MMGINLSRREFFQRFTHDISDQEPQSDWIAIAKQSEMSPGVEKNVTIENLSLTLRSSGEGIWANFEDGKRIALRVEAMGVVSANPKIEWPVYRALSHITGEAVDLVQDLQNDDSKREISHESRQ